MKPSDFQKTIQCQFDCKLKRVVKGIVRNYRKELKRRRNKEISYCELPEIVVENLAVWDEYESDYTAFNVCGIEVRVLDDDLAEAIKYLMRINGLAKEEKQKLSQNAVTTAKHFSESDVAKRYLENITGEL